MRQYLKVLILLLCLFALGACSKKIEGEVKDPFGKGIPGVTVKIDKSNFTATTDANGKYQIDYAPGNLVVMYSKPNYTTIKLDLSLLEKTKFPAETIVMYPIPSRPGLFYVGNAGLVELDVNGSISEVATALPFFSLSRNYKFFVEGKPEKQFSSGTVRFIDTLQFPLALASCTNQLVYEGELNAFQRKDIYNGVLNGNTELIGAEQLPIRVYDLTPGQYAFIQTFRSDMIGAIPKKDGAACLFSVSEASTRSGSSL